MAISESNHDSGDGYTLRMLSTMDDLSLVERVLSDAFGTEGLVDPDPETSPVEPKRAIVVEFDGEPVSTLGAQTRDLVVPGAILPATHLIQGGVRQTHRRHGLMTRMMVHQLRTAHAEHGESIAVLWASEARIYQRYGFGLCFQNHSFAVDTRELRVNGVPDDARLREGNPVALASELRAIFDEVMPTRPGWSSRGDRHWGWPLNDLPPELRMGASGKRALLHDGPDGPDGYAIWSRKQEWTGSLASGEAIVHEVVATNPAAYVALWRFLLTVDLTRTVRSVFAAQDEPLWQVVNEPLRLGVTARDGMWLRLLDLPDALTRREYATPIDIVLEIEDEMFPDNAGRWRLTAANGAAKCVSTTDEPQLSMDVSVVSSAYLGGVSLASHAAVGRIAEHRPGALAEASTAFGWPIAPSALDIF